MVISQKLGDTFNDCAGKIIKDEEYKSLFKKEMGSLTLREMYALDKFFESSEIKKRITKLHMLYEVLEFQNKLAAAIGDESSDGRYADVNEAGQQGEERYFNVNFLRFLLTNEETRKLVSNLPDSLDKKIEEIAASVIRKAHDYRDDVRQGKLKLIPLVK